MFSFCTSSQDCCLKPEGLLLLVQWVNIRRRTASACGAAPHTATTPGGRLLGVSGDILLSVNYNTYRSIRWDGVSINGSSLGLESVSTILSCTKFSWSYKAISGFVTFVCMFSAATKSHQLLLCLSSCSSQNGCLMSSEYREVKTLCLTPNGEAGNTHTHTVLLDIQLK